MLEIKVKYFTDVEPIKFIENKSDWYDLRSAEEIEMKAGEFRLIKLGVGMKLPAGYEAIVAPRSSTFKNFGILQTNSIGVIDESYSGDNDQWMMPALAMRDTVIHKNDRICQFRIIAHQPTHTITTVEHLDDKDRGGIGSTGKQ
ncbi:MAG: deoxyuridine 5'-triphosphate nucleotidohydrolase [Clostridiales bacterium]|nr:deoxyuridine 5'-triphosphate nucleotidohydrolase [Clostridiales bacterium]